MKSESFGSIKLIEFSNNITKEELIECARILEAWAADHEEYAVISHMPKNAKSVTDMATISKTLSAIRNSTLRIYGTQSSGISSFIANIVGQLLGLTIVQAPDYPTLLKKIKADNPKFEADLETYKVEDRLKVLA